jgi:hypothetical protein
MTNQLMRPSVYRAHLGQGANDSSVQLGNLIAIIVNYFENFNTMIILCDGFNYSTIKCIKLIV